MIAAATVPLLIPTPQGGADPLVVLDLFGRCVLAVMASGPNDVLPAMVTLVAADEGRWDIAPTNLPVIGFRAEQARVLGLQLQAYADQADQLQEAHELALADQEERAAP